MKTLKELIFWNFAKNNIDIKDSNIPDELKEQYDSILNMTVPEMLLKAKTDEEFAILILQNEHLFSKLGSYDEAQLGYYNKFMFFSDNSNSIMYFQSVSGIHLENFLKLHRSVWEKAKEMGLHQLLSNTQQKQLESHHFPDKSSVMLYFGN